MGAVGKGVACCAAGLGIVRWTFKREGTCIYSAIFMIVVCSSSYANVRYVQEFVINPSTPEPSFRNVQAASDVVTYQRKRHPCHVTDSKRCDTITKENAALPYTQVTPAVKQGKRSMVYIYILYLHIRSPIGRSLGLSLSSNSQK